MFADLPVGEKVKLAELKALANQDKNLRALTKDEKAKMLAVLEDNRQHFLTSARSSNAAAARDMLCVEDKTTKSVSDLMRYQSCPLYLHSCQFDGLAHRTGARAVYFMVPGHVNDTAAPMWYGTKNTMQFFKDTFKLDPNKICRLLHV